MTTRQHLEQINKLNLMINNKLQEIYELRTIATRVTISTETERVKSSPTNVLENSVAKIIDKQWEIERLVDELIDKRTEIIGQIDKIENQRFYSILTYKYVQCLTIKEIQSKMNLQERQVKNLCTDAILEFERLYGTEFD